MVCFRIHKDDVCQMKAWTSSLVGEAATDRQATLKTLPHADTYAHLLHIFYCPTLHARDWLFVVQNL